jgi:hypothetical protein
MDRLPNKERNKQTNKKETNRKIGKERERGWQQAGRQRDKQCPS